MKLNVGCSWPKGKYKQDDWINLDLLSNKRVNVQGNALALPFKTCSIDEVHCSHLLEHLTRDKNSLVIREMHRVLKKGGLCYIETPDFRGTIELLHQAFANQFVDGIHHWTTAVYGKSEREGMSHHWGFYEGLLRREMRENGFRKVERVTAVDEMISTHYTQEPILLVKGMK